MKLGKKIISAVIAFVSAFAILLTIVPVNTMGAEYYDTAKPECELISAAVVNRETGVENTTGIVTDADDIIVKFRAMDDVGVDRIIIPVMIEQTNPYATIEVGVAAYQSDETSESKIERISGSSTDGIYLATITPATVDYKGEIYPSYIEVSDAAGNSYDLFLLSDYRWQIDGESIYTPEYSTVEIVSIKNYDLKIYDSLGKELKEGSVIAPGTTVTYQLTCDEFPSDCTTLDAFLSSSLNYVNDIKNITFTRVRDTNVYTANFTFDDKMYPTIWSIDIRTSTEDKYYRISGHTLGALVLKNGGKVVYPEINVSLMLLDFDSYLGFKDYQIPKCAMTYRELLDDVIAKYAEQPPLFSDYEYVFNVEVTDEDGKSLITIKGDELDNYITESVLTLNRTVKDADKKVHVQLVDLVLPTIEEDGTPGYSFWNTEDIYVDKTEDIDKAVKAYATQRTPKEFGEVTVSRDGGDEIIFYSCSTEKVYIEYIAQKVIEDKGEFLIKVVPIVKGIYDRINVPTYENVVANLNKLEKEDVADAKFVKWNMVTDDADLFLVSDETSIAGFDCASAQYDKIFVNFFYFDESFFYTGQRFFSTADAQVIKETFDNEHLLGISDWKVDYISPSSGPYGEHKGYYSVGISSNSSIPEKDATGHSIKTEVKETEIKTNDDGSKQVQEELNVGTADTVLYNGATALSSVTKLQAVNMIQDALATTETLGDEDSIETPQVKIDMADATVIPTEILEAAKGKDVDVVFEMENGVAWSINGKDITAESFKDVNLKVNTNTNNVPKAVISRLVGDDKPVIQMNLADHGLFGFKAKLKIYVGKEYSGEYANLLYYTSDGRLELQDAGIVDADGYSEVAFTHASDYLLAMGEKMTTDPTNEGPIAGDSSMLPWMVAMAVALGMMTIGVATRRKFTI